MDDDEFLRMHRERYAAREAAIAAMKLPDMSRAPFSKPEPQPSAPRVQDLISRRPIERTEEQEAMYRRGKAMLEIEEALAAHEAEQPGRTGR